MPPAGFSYEGTPDIPIGMTVAEWKALRAREAREAITARRRGWVRRALRRREVP